MITWCARCGMVPAFEWWRDKLAVCESCWGALEAWAFQTEHGVREMVARKEEKVKAR